MKEKDRLPPMTFSTDRQIKRQGSYARLGGHQVHRFHDRHTTIPAGHPDLRPGAFASPAIARLASSAVSARNF
ncbi:MAG TPA: hypothetical protein VGJ92_02235, partial [Methanocella sp.]